MEWERIQHELKYYRSYKVAIETTKRNIQAETNGNSWERNRYEDASPCRVTVYDDMPLGGGSGSREPVLSGGMSFEDIMEFERYKEIVSIIDMALNTMAEIERDIITMKWMDELTLAQIAERKGFSYGTAKTIHGRAVEKMKKSLRFYYIPWMEVPVA